jgi:hypothetical protein
MTLNELQNQYVMTLTIACDLAKRAEPFDMYFISQVNALDLLRAELLSGLEARESELVKERDELARAASHE